MSAWRYLPSDFFLNYILRRAVHAVCFLSAVGLLCSDVVVGVWWGIFLKHDKSNLGGKERQWLLSLLAIGKTKTQSISQTPTKEWVGRWGGHIGASICLPTQQRSLSPGSLCLCCGYSKSLSCRHVSQIRWTWELKPNQLWKVIWGDNTRD